MEKNYKRRIKLIIFSLLGLFVMIALINNTIVTEGQSSPIPTREIVYDFDVPDSNLSRAIYLNLRAALAIDNKTKKVLYAYNADEIRPVASISKLLTAMVVLDNYNPDTVIEITRKDAYRSSRSIFRVGDKVHARDLLHAALMVSDNRAARALARTTAGSLEKFAIMMNKKAIDIGLDNTDMCEPTGLDENNCASAADCARMVNTAKISYPEIARITGLKKYEFRLVNRNRKKKLINTNKMIFSKYKVLAGKTGYIIASDYCLTTVLQDNKGEEITVVVLGSPGSNTRFREARRLANYAFRQIG